MGTGPPAPAPSCQVGAEGLGALPPFPSVPEPSLFPLPGPISPALLLECLRTAVVAWKKSAQVADAKKRKKRKRAREKKTLLICMLTYIYLHVRLPCAELSPGPWVVTFPAGRKPACSPLPRSPEPTLLAHPGWRQTPSSGKGFSSLHDPDLC